MKINIATAWSVSRRVQRVCSLEAVPTLLDQQIFSCRSVQSNDGDYISKEIFFKRAYIVRRNGTSFFAAYSRTSTSDSYFRRICVGSTMQPSMTSPARERDRGSAGGSGARSRIVVPPSRSVDPHPRSRRPVEPPNSGMETDAGGELNAGNAADQDLGVSVSDHWHPTEYDDHNDRSVG